MKLSIEVNVLFIGRCQRLQCHLTQGNAVPTPPVFEIQRSQFPHLKFHKKTLRAHNNLFGEAQKLMYSSLTSDLKL